MPSVPSRNFVREAEIKHGRLALLALPTLAGISWVTGDPDPVSFLSRQPAEAQLSFFALAGVVESVSLRRLDGKFSLREGVVPGRLLPVNGTHPSLTFAEDVAGRAAMAVAAVTILASVV